MIEAKIKSHAKLNLALNITGKTTYLHKIESIIVFTDLHDEIFISKINSRSHNILFTGKFSKNISKDNTVTKLLQILENKKLLKNKKFKIRINKKIPNRAGLGGGSMNAANILKFFIKKKIIKTSKKEIINISKLIGSDVILGLNSKNSILNSRNEIKYFSNCKKFYTLIVKPNFGCSTKDIYGKIKLFSKSQLTKNTKNILNINNIKSFDNDLEAIVLRKYPKLKKLKLFIQDLPRVKIVRMTGSGSSIIAYFRTRNNSLNAAKIFRKKYKNYWCILSKTI